MEKYFYTYVLLSQIDGRFYIGFTGNLEKRIAQHNTGKVNATRHRRPFSLVFFEACKSKEDAVHREKYFKMGYGRRFLQGRLKHFLTHNK